MTLTKRGRRSGVSAVEFALISPVLLLLLFGLVIGGHGIFRYHQTASLAREAARYAVVHGLDYQRETGQPAATQASIYNDVVLANAAGMDPADLTCTVTWDQSNAPKRPTASGGAVTNVVSVTVTYQWMSGWVFGDFTMSSTSTMPMSY